MTRSTAHSRTWKSIASLCTRWRSSPSAWRTARTIIENPTSSKRSAPHANALRSLRLTSWATTASFCSTTMKTSQGQFKKGTVRSLLAALREDDSLPEFTPQSPRSAKAPTGTPSETSTKRCSTSTRYSAAPHPETAALSLQRSGMSAGVFERGGLRGAALVDRSADLEAARRERRTVRHPCGAVRKQPALPGNRSAAVPASENRPLRVNQIEAVYDVDVHDPDDFLQILLAGRIMTLAENVG